MEEGKDGKCNLLFYLVGRKRKLASCACARVVGVLAAVLINAPFFTIFILRREVKKKRCEYYIMHVYIV